MKKLLFPSAILCALFSAAFVAPASAQLAVTSTDTSQNWSKVLVGTVPVVHVDVNFSSDNPNTTTQSFNKDFFLFRGTSSISSRTLPINISPGVRNYTFEYEDYTTNFPYNGSSWNLYYNLPGDPTTGVILLRNSPYTYNY